MMRKLMILLLILALPGVLQAADLSNTRPSPVKSPSVVFHPSSTQSQPGDDIPLAFIVPSLPFSDSGSTCNFLDDYLGSCMAGGSPDVVYGFTPSSGILVTVDLNGSSYDTGLYILDAGGNELVCNDDFIGLTSRVENFPMSAGVTYYIVVDGFGGECGDYSLNITSLPPCVVQCPADAVPEGEPTPYDGYVDAINGGCNSTPAVFQPINWINADDPNGAAWLCGTSGWYHDPDGTNFRDTDWFSVTALTTGTMTFEIQGEYALQQLVVNPDCSDPVILEEAHPGPCEVSSLSWSATAGETFWLWVGPDTYSGPVSGFNYFMKVTGNSYGTVPAEQTAWGAVKSIFR